MSKRVCAQTAAQNDSSATSAIQRAPPAQMRFGLRNCRLAATHHPLDVRSSTARRGFTWKSSTADPPLALVQQALNQPAWYSLSQKQRVEIGHTGLVRLAIHAEGDVIGHARDKHNRNRPCRLCRPQCGTPDRTAVRALTAQSPLR